MGNVFGIVIVIFADYTCIRQYIRHGIHHDDYWLQWFGIWSIMASGGNVPGFPGRDQINQLKGELDANLRQIELLQWRLSQLQKTAVGRVVASAGLIAQIDQQIDTLRLRNIWIIDQLNRIA